MRFLVPALVALVMLYPQAAETPRIVDGLAQPAFSATDVVRHNVWVEIAGLDSDRDGANDRIRLEIHRPAATERGTRLPVVLVASPYAGGTLPYPRHDLNINLFVPGRDARKPAPQPEPRPSFPRWDGTEPPIREMRGSGYEGYFLPRGFVFAYANSLGTGHSTGCPTIGGHEENLAIKAAIDWFNGRAKGFDAEGQEVRASWTTGATAMIGTSYDGTLPIGAATLGVEGLRAIVPIAGVSSYYDHRRSYGTVINSYPQAGTDADTLFDNILSRKHPEACQYMRAQIVAGMDRQSGDYNAFWQERNYVKAIDRRFKAAVLIQHGLNDFNTKPRHAARLWQALKAHGIPSKIWWHQGPHGDRANQARPEHWRTELNRFWTQYLFGADNGFMKGASAIVEREDKTWVEYSSWPVPGAAPVALSLLAAPPGGEGRLAVERPSNSRSEESFTDNATIDADALAAAATSPHRLLYQTGTLSAPVHVSGVPEVSLRVSFGAPAAIISAMLVDYRPSGKPFIVSRGWADPQNRESIEKTTAVVPGQAYTIRFELQPHDYVFPPGSRIGLMVLSSDQLFTQRPPPGTTVTLQASESTFILPVVGGQKAVVPAGIAATGGRIAAR